MDDMSIEEIRELFSQYGFIVGDIDINEEEYLADVYVEVAPTETYTIDSIEDIIKKVKKLQEELLKEGIIKDIKMGNLYKGNWRILVHFKTEE